MEAIEFLNKLDLNKLDLFDTRNTTSWFVANSSIQIKDTKLTVDPCKVNYSKNGFIFPFKDKTLKNYELVVYYSENFSRVKINCFGITYEATNLPRKEREWLEDWSRKISEEINRLREEKLLSFLIKD